MKDCCRETYINTINELIHTLTCFKFFTIDQHIDALKRARDSLQHDRMNEIEKELDKSIVRSKSRLDEIIISMKGEDNVDK